jgi:hypothetical protein
VEYIFPRYFLYFWQIYGAAICISFAVNMKKLGNFVIIIIMLNLSVFIFLVCPE